MISIQLSEYVSQLLEAPFSPNTPTIHSLTNCMNSWHYIMQKCVKMCVHPSRCIAVWCSIACINVDTYPPPTDPPFPRSLPSIILNDMKRAEDRYMHELIGLNRTVQKFNPQGLMEAALSGFKPLCIFSSGLFYFSLSSSFSYAATFSSQSMSHKKAVKCRINQEEDQRGYLTQQMYVFKMVKLSICRHQNKNTNGFLSTNWKPLFG